jgi:5-hydroxyisourate hydrolase-like protein (transthyretin family)
MVRSIVFRLTVLLAGFGLAFSSLAANGQSDTSQRGRHYKAPPPTGRIEVTVLKEVNGKPIENAAVIFHPMEGEKDKGNMELKTNEDGKTIIDVLPIGGTVRMQVIAKGYQTFGDDYKVDKADMAIEIRMKRPGEQYSIYKKHEAAQEGGKDAAPAKAPDSAAPANSTPPADSATPPSSTAPPK